MDDRAVRSRMQGGSKLMDLEQDAADIFSRAFDQYKPIRVFAGFSGGGDSIVLAHWARHRIDALFHIDTGTAIPGVREHIDSAAAHLGLPVEIYSAGEAFKKLVLGTDAFWDEYDNARCTQPDLTLRAFITHQRTLPGKGVAPQQPYGFPGPGGHGLAYTRLKERMFDALRRDVKKQCAAKHRDKIMMLTGVRRTESARRAKREEITVHGSMVFVSPLTNWSGEAMREYRERHQLPTSDISALIHMSGECTCGAYASPDEREMLMALWPEWWAETHGALERAAEERGLRACVWGQRPPKGELHDLESYEVGPFCAGCDFKRAA